MKISLEQLNYIIYIILIIVFFLVLTDHRIDLKRKTFFIIINILFFNLSIIIEKAPYLIIKDLFWYSLILNISFIFHILILERIFIWAWRKRKFSRYKENFEYLAFLISRISYTCSLWGLIYFLQKLIYEITWFLDSWDLSFHKYNNKYLDEEINKNRYPYRWKYVKFYNEKIINNKLGKSLMSININIKKIFNIFFLILFFFSKNFHNYTAFLLGKNKKLNWKEIFKSICLFLFFFIISLCLGVPRLYIIWIFLALWELYNILTFKYDKLFRGEYNLLNLKDKLLYINEKGLYYLTTVSLEFKYSYLYNISKDIYSKFFMFDLIKFIYNKYTGRYCSLLMTYLGDDLYPIDKVYRFYLWEELIKGYLNFYSKNLNNEFDEIIIKECLVLIKLINADENLLYKLCENLLIDKLSIDEFIKNKKT